jgi:RNA polymerase sigma-70 factor, ECF subfamily
MPDWREILSRDGPAAWRTAYQRLGNRADADECFQEACLVALEVSRREVVHNWRGLLQRLAVARSLDRLRVRWRAGSRISLFPCDQVRDHSPSPSQNVEVAELADELRRALAQIPPN